MNQEGKIQFRDYAGRIKHVTIAGVDDVSKLATFVASIVSYTNAAIELVAVYTPTVADRVAVPSTEKGTDLVDDKIKCRFSYVDSEVTHTVHFDLPGVKNTDRELGADSRYAYLLKQHGDAIAGLIGIASGQAPVFVSGKQKNRK